MKVYRRFFDGVRCRLPGAYATRYFAAGIVATLLWSQGLTAEDHTVTRRSRRLRNLLAIPLMLAAALLVTGCDKLDFAMPKQWRQMSLSSLADKKSPCVYKIEVYDGAGNQAGSGTGFAVSPDGILVTNYHVIKFAPAIRAINSDQRSIRVEEVIAYNKEDDLALLRLSEPTPRYLELVLERDVRVGSNVAVIGGPLGLEGSVSSGIISAFRRIDDDDVKGNFLQITAPISPGSSGSPVFTMDGRVAGVATMNLTGGQQLNFAVPSSRIMALAMTARESTTRVKMRNSVVEGKDPYFKDPDYKKATQTFDDGNVSLAQERYVELLKKYPQSASAHAHVGETLRRQGRNGEAVQYLNRALNLEKEVPWFWASYGKALHREEHFPQAIQAYQQAVKMDDTDAETHAGLGELLLRNDDMEGAVRHYSKAVRFDGSNARWWRDLARLHMKNRNWEDGQEAAIEAVRLDPRDTGSIMVARECMRQRGLSSRELDEILNGVGAVLAGKHDGSSGSGGATKPRPRSKQAAPPARNPSTGVVTSGDTSQPGYLGNWNGDGASISIHSNNTFRANVEGYALSGTWSRAGDNYGMLHFKNGVGGTGSYKVNRDGKLELSIRTSRCKFYSTEMKRLSM